ncbi:NAD(P)H-dependent glycerol-3-phosphate dehydrogenase [Vacuolonema iberomarrocanum]|uniref:NAD(P)H-dependent glycerol-3-phosphate dehydrogenase n=1 Tax=Vacuolonema iberomarrocanum TaxID=3454632 RepID=UPI003F6DEA31
MPTPDFSLPLTLTILGAGAWGTVLSFLLEHNGHKIRLWSRRHDQSLAATLEGCPIIVSAVSIKGVPALARQVRQIGLAPGTILVSATKGLDGETTCLASQIWQENLPEHPVVVLSGPNLAKEIKAGLPAATVVASHQPDAAQTVQQVLASERFRVYTHHDPLGTELGGTLKNVVAIAAGVSDGLELGTNAKSALITRALSEFTRVGTVLGGKTETFFGLSGLGDLLATCNSPLSRNYQVGFRLAQGQSLETALAEIGETAEGVNTANVLFDIAQQKNISMPIAHQVYLLIHKKVTPSQAVEALMERELKPETPGA